MKKIGMGKNTEGYLCVWDDKGAMHYISDRKSPDCVTLIELNQAKIMTLLFKMCRKLKINPKI